MKIKRCGNIEHECCKWAVDQKPEANNLDVFALSYLWADHLFPQKADDQQPYDYNKHYHKVDNQHSKPLVILMYIILIDHRGSNPAPEKSRQSRVFGV